MLYAEASMVDGLNMPGLSHKIGFVLLQDELNGRCGWVAGFYCIRNCLYAISQLTIDDQPQIILFLPDDIDTTTFGFPIDNQPWLDLVHIPREQLDDARLHSQVEDKINSYQCDLFFPMLAAPQFNLHGAHIGWIPDHQEKHLPQYFNADDLYYRKAINGFISTYCDSVLCISHACGNDFRKYYPENADKRRVIHPRAHIAREYLAMEPACVLAKYGLENHQYIYMPNQFWIHKNHKLVFEAWRRLKEAGRNYVLVCTGYPHDYRRPDYHSELLSYLRDNGLTAQVRILGFINRAEQIQLYRGACAVLQPSLFEGWNTSLEDAKALGKFIIASDIPAQREQCQENVVFFNPHDSAHLAEIVIQAWDSLPPGFDRQAEDLAGSRYDHLMMQFGRDLIAMFTDAIRQHQLDSSLGLRNRALMHLPVFLNRQLQARQKDCDDRLALINQMHKKLHGRRFSRILNLFR